MSAKRQIQAGMVAGALWGAIVVHIGVVHVDIPIFSLSWTLAFALMLPGLFLAAVIGRLAHRRYGDEARAGGLAPEPGEAAAIDGKVLQNSVEQMVLALATWPAIGYFLATDGPGVVLCLGIGFALARVAFWIGYHLSPPLRAFGFAATFYPTLMALGWTLLRWLGV